MKFLELREEMKSHSDDSTTTEDMITKSNTTNANLNYILPIRKRSQAQRKNRHVQVDPETLVKTQSSMIARKNYLSEPSAVTTLESYFIPDEFSPPPLRRTLSPILARSPTATENEDNVVDHSGSITPTQSKTPNGSYTQSNFHQSTSNANDEIINDSTEYNSTNHDRPPPAGLGRRRSSTPTAQLIKSRSEEPNENSDSFFD